MGWRATETSARVEACRSPGARLPADPAKLDSGRYSDEQLYALALYIYSLKPPPNPNTFDALAARGQQVFERDGCASCHTPPLYTNNKLTPAPGFTPPDDHLAKYDMLNVSVGTDPELATEDPTRHGLLQGAVAQRRLVSRAVRTQRLGRDTRRLVRSATGCATTTCPPASRATA